MIDIRAKLGEKQNLNFFVFQFGPIIFSLAKTFLYHMALGNDSFFV